MKSFVIIVAIVMVIVIVSCVGVFGQDRDPLTLPNEVRLNKRQPPELILKTIGIKPGMIVGEVGAGRGRYTVQIASRIKTSGILYANDIDENVLRFLEKRCSEQGFTNVKTVLGTVSDPKLPNNELDMVIMVNVVHCLDRPVDLLQNVGRSLKSDGQIVIVEGNRDKNTSVTAWYTRRKLLGIFRDAGYILVREETFLPEDNIYFLKISHTEKNVSDFPMLIGPYLGQKPSGMTPEIFARGLISTEYTEFGISFSPDGEEMCFTRRRSRDEHNRIYYMKMVDSHWTEPQIAPFGYNGRESEPNFSPDGEKIYFNSRRPLPKDIKPLFSHHVWVVHKLDTTWGEPNVLDSPIMEAFPMFVTEANNGNLYFTGNVERGIYRSKYRNGQYESPERLPDAVNSVNWAGHPFIDPDERYIIFDANIDKEGTKNLYISYRKEDGGWTESINISRYYDLPEHSWSPFVTFDGKYFFFSGNKDIVWIDAKILDKLKPKGIQY